MTHGTQPSRLWMALGWAGLAVCLGLTGCTGEYGGQNLPSGYYLSQQVQYYPAGPEFKLSQEAAAQKAYRDTEAERTPLQH